MHPPWLQALEPGLRVPRKYLVNEGLLLGDLPAPVPSFPCTTLRTSSTAPHCSLLSQTAPLRECAPRTAMCWVPCHLPEPDPVPGACQPLGSIELHFVLDHLQRSPRARPALPESLAPCSCADTAQLATHSWTPLHAGGHLSVWGWRGLHRTAPVLSSGKPNPASWAEAPARLGSPGLGCGSVHRSLRSGLLASGWAAGQAASPTLM